MKKIVAIIQARLGSTRLPRKVLMDVCGKTALEWVIERVKRSKNIDLIVVATTSKKEDKAIIGLAKRCGVKSFTGSEEDVLDRYYQCAKKYKADIIVRLTGDCVLIDPRLVNKVIKNYLKSQGNLDYTALGLSYPDGLDTEVFGFSLLEKTWLEAKKKEEREHVTPYIWKKPDKFKVDIIEHNQDLHRLKWTLDNSQDLILIRKIYEYMNKNKPGIFYMEDVLELLKKQPQLIGVKSNIERPGYKEITEMRAKKSRLKNVKN